MSLNSSHSNKSTCTGGKIFKLPAQVGMFLGCDHQKEQIIDAHLLKTGTDCDATCDPRLEGLCLHGGSSAVAVDMYLEAVTV